jgi:hypothetical protein
MKSHLTIMLVFAALVSAAFALLMREERRDQVKFGFFVFFCFVASALALGWLMYPFPG